MSDHFGRWPGQPWGRQAQADLTSRLRRLIFGSQDLNRTKDSGALDFCLPLSLCIWVTGVGKWASKPLSPTTRQPTNLQVALGSASSTPEVFKEK